MEALTPEVIEAFATHIVKPTLGFGFAALLVYLILR